MHTSKAPRRVLKRLHILDIDNEHITRLGRLDLEGTTQVMHFRQINITDIVCRVVVLDLSSCPVDTLDLDSFAILDGTGSRNCECVKLLLQVLFRDSVLAYCLDAIGSACSQLVPLLGKRCRRFEAYVEEWLCSGIFLQINFIHISQSFGRHVDGLRCSIRGLLFGSA